MWTAVVVTCPHASWCGPLEAKVRTIVGLGIGGCDGLEAGDTVLVVPDPGDDDTRVGSGGATLNALLVVTEHLSARSQLHSFNFFLGLFEGEMFLKVDKCNQTFDNNENN